MTRQEAYQAMMAGKWITHKLFSKNEHLKMPYTTILDEKNNHFEKGWKMRKGSNWENGWSIKEKNK